MTPKKNPSSVYNGHSAFFMGNGPYFVVKFRVDGIERRVRVAGEEAAKRMAAQYNGAHEPYTMNVED